MTTLIGRYALSLGTCAFLTALSVGSARAHHENAGCGSPSSPSSENILEQEQYASELRQYAVCTLIQQTESAVVSISVRNVTNGRQVQFGTGFIIDSSGLIVTNNHVVGSPNSRIVVRLLDGREMEGTIIGTDPIVDLALIYIGEGSSEVFPTVSFGDSDAMRRGHSVFAFGHPFGLEHTVTSGIVSGFHRIGSGVFDNHIQIDAAINPGNSGGPLLNIYGEVIGVNVAIYSPINANIGLNFAIPSNLAASVLEELRLYGRVRRGWIGVTRSLSVNERFVETFNLPVTSGARIMAILPGSPAEIVGLQVNDVILSWNGMPISDDREFQGLVLSTFPGTASSIGVFRPGTEGTEGRFLAFSITPIENPALLPPSVAEAPEEESSPDAESSLERQPEGEEETSTPVPALRSRRF